jgi:hypothetical protein
MSLKDVLQICNATHQGSTTLVEEPLRVMLPIQDGRGFRIVPYVHGAEYIAVSYTWPNTSWTRLYNSSNAVLITNQSSSELSHHVSEFAQAALQSLTHGLKDMAVWVDHECIEQSDLTEKATQVAVMDRIYSSARLTVVLLEDIELGTDELEFLQRMRYKTGSEKERHALIVKRILSARWFSRAWCSQEMILSMGTMIFVHRTGEPLRPIAFNFVALSGWISGARMSDPAISPVTGPRGSNSLSKNTSMGLDTIAWAYGTVSNMGCYNTYDKISLAFNLIRAPISSRLVLLPDTQGQHCPIADTNVHKILNVSAILKGDFSLLLVNHVQHNPLQQHVGFRWGGSPVKADTISEIWIPKHYDVNLDPNIILSSSGLRLKGYAAKILQQYDWRIWHDPLINILHSSIDGIHTTISSTWLTNPQFDAEADKSILRDILYTIEHYNAREIYPLFTPPPTHNDFIERDPFPPNASLKDDILTQNSRFGPALRLLAQSLEFLKNQDGSITFKVIEIEGGTVMVVKGNVEEMEGKWLFQPHVTRPKLFAPGLLTMNSMVLDSMEPGEDVQSCSCIGGVRGFQLISREFGECTVVVM